MFEKLKQLYIDGKLSTTGLALAVQKGWITEVERILIIESIPSTSSDDE